MDGCAKKQPIFNHVASQTTLMVFGVSVILDSIGIVGAPLILKAIHVGEWDATGSTGQRIFTSFATNVEGTRRRRVNSNMP